MLLLHQRELAEIDFVFIIGALRPQPHCCIHVWRISREHLLKFRYSPSAAQDACIAPLLVKSIASAIGLLSDCRHLFLVSYQGTASTSRRRE